ncbi:DnaB-like helicase C-terminal domain-containing protein [Streptomyces avermitilis]|uniref:DnaB-like helicase C-terminal domain-containing protein n=1 Tax=Streptomyces avermitilis TaxID=33903 RepID=UPI0033A16CEB
MSADAGSPLGDAIGDVLSSGTAPGLSFGLAGLDEATGGLHPGRLVLVAAEPQVGGSLIGLAAARYTALVRNGRVLYAASGPNSADITRRIIAAEADGDYARLKTGVLTPHEQDVVERLRHAPLFIDDGSDDSAPEQNAELAGIPVRATWVPADALGPARHEVLLAVLDERAPRQADVRELLTRAEGRFDACLDGLLLTVVRSVSELQPRWQDLEQVLLGSE